MPEVETMSAAVQYETEKNTAVLRESAYYRIDKLVWEMRQAKNGLEMKLQKGFFTSISNACTGKELVAWLKNKLLTSTDAEALHFANALCRLGYIVPVNEKQFCVKLDSSCYRLQRPALWPSRKWEGSSEEYAIYLLKKQEKNKSLDSYEQAELGRLERFHALVWDQLKATARDSVSKYSRGSKIDKEIEDSQDRSFWRVHRPPPGQKAHHYKVEAFNKNSVCMEAINQNRKREILDKKIKFMKLYLEKAEHHSEQTGEKTITILKNHCQNYQDHDPLLTKQDITNPWKAIDEYFYEDLVELEERKHTRLDLESWTLGFRKLMSDCYGKQLFAAFLQQEYSLENLYFWEACEDLKQCPQSRVQPRLERIRRDFLEPSSKYEVNLDRLVVQSTVDEMQKPTRFCMDTAQRHIYNLMKDDCYPRFLKSDTYRSLLHEYSDKRSVHSGVNNKARHYPRDSATSLGLIKKFYQKRDRKSSLSTPTKISLTKRSSPISSIKEVQSGLDRTHHKFISANNLSSHDSHPQVSPFYGRRASNASPAISHRSPCLDSGYNMRKAGSLSSLVVTNNNGRKKKSLKAHVEDESDKLSGLSDDSCASSTTTNTSTGGFYNAATYSPKTRAPTKKSGLRKKHSFS